MPYKNKEDTSACRKRNYHKHKERVIKWHEDNKEQVRHTQRLAAVKRMYNLDADEYLGKILQQDNKCAICRKPESVVNRDGDVRPLCVDHNHATGRVRDLLCNRCNAALGHVDDNISTLKAMVVYLEKHKE